MKQSIARSALIPTLLLPLAVMAQGLQPHDGIRGAAEGFIAKQLGSSSDGSVMHVTATQLDPRLRLNACEKPLSAALPPTARIGARVTVGVSCPQPRWTVYVPVNIETELNVLVLRKAASRGSSLTAADVEPRSLVVPGLADTYIRDVGQLAGRHLIGAVAPGTALSIELLAADILVKRGQRVTLVVAVGGLEVRAQGEAVGDATAAGRVRVLNLDSRRIVEGQVESRDRVRIGL
jgi:flagella basal body P-ring formation protein FlgA